MTAAVLFQAFPPLSPDEYRALHDSIEQHGIQVPILVDSDGVVVDGHHRKKIATELGIAEVPTRVLDRTYTETEKRTLALTLNLDRRHLTREERRAIVEASVKADPELSDREHAKRTGVSPTTVGSVRSALVERGDVSKLDTRTDSLGRQQPATKPVSADEQVADLVQRWDDFKSEHPIPPFDSATGEVLDDEPLVAKTYTRPEPKPRRSALIDAIRPQAERIWNTAIELRGAVGDDRFPANRTSISEVVLPRVRAAALDLTAFLAELDLSPATETEEARDRLAADLNHISETFARLARSLMEDQK